MKESSRFVSSADRAAGSLSAVRGAVPRDKESSVRQSQASRVGRGAAAASVRLGVAFSAGVAAFGAATASHGADRLVPQQYATIQAAVNASANGDRVLIAAGTYSGSVTIAGKSLTLRGADWSSTAPQTHLTGSGTVITCTGTGAQQVTLENLLIRDATKGVYADNVEVVLNDCHLVNFNNPSQNGGCYQQRYRSLAANRCWFSRGRAAYGGGVYIGFASATFTDCVFDGNEATLQGGGGFVQSGSSLRLVRCFAASQFFDICTNSAGYMRDSAFCNSRMLAACSGSSVIDEGGNTQQKVCADCDGQAGADLIAIGLGVGDCDGDLVPDHCDEPCAPILWPASEGGNGHWYIRVPRLGRTWPQCRAFAMANGADLASIGSAEEEQRIALLVPSAVVNGYWNAVFVGGSQTPGAPPLSGWTWSDGSPWNGVNWQAGQPNGGEGYLGMYRLADGSDALRYGDWPTSDPGVYYFLLEWSADCNGDGVVDFGQIQTGELEDANANSVPDCCESGGSCAPCAGDITGNGVVDGIDLAAVLGAWGSAGKGEFAADVTGDGQVDGADLAVVLSGWGPCP